MVKSTRLISAGSAVRVRPPAPRLARVGQGRSGRPGRYGSRAPASTALLHPTRSTPVRHPSSRSANDSCRCSTASGSSFASTIWPAPSTRVVAARVGRVGLGRARASSARARCRRRSAPRRRRPLQPSASTVGRRRANVLRREWRRRSGARSSSSAATSPARARSERRSIEDAARASRHEFFERARVACLADDVALGHTRDDQAETFLLRLTARRRIPRPRGHVSAEGTESFARCSPAAATSCAPGSRRVTIAFVEDESNRDVSIPRNRVRAELLPLLEAPVQPGHRRRAGRRGRAGARDLGVDGRR